MLKLYCSRISPYARKARVALIEMDAAEHVEEIQIDPFDPPSEFVALNPLSKIPVLLTEDAVPVLGSEPILDYITERFGGLTPLPEGPERWTVLHHRQLGEGIIDAAVATVLEKRRPEGIVYTPHLDRQLAKIEGALEQLESAAARQLTVAQPTLLEITIAVALGYLDFRMPYVDWRKRAPALLEWQAAFVLRRSMQQTQPSEP